MNNNPIPMDKKQFFESLVTLLPDNSGQKLQALVPIQGVFTSIKSKFSDKRLRSEFELLEKELLFYVWMFEQICNGSSVEGNIHKIAWPLIVISVSGEILFVNKTYCEQSGLSPSEVQLHAKAGTLYTEVYADADQANEAISRLQAGKGYKELELFMKHSEQRISWNSYGWVGELLEIRSGRVVSEENDQKKERERFYRGSLMNTSRLVENLYRISALGALSPDDEQRLMWIQEFLSMSDFLWNHSEFFMEIINIPVSKDKKIYGCYNTVYAQFLKCSFEEQKPFKNTLSLAHGSTISKFLETRTLQSVSLAKESVFYQRNKRPVAQVYWQYSTYPHETPPGYTRMFSMGVLIRKIQKKNIFARIFQSIFTKHDAKN